MPLDLSTDLDRIRQHIPHLKRFAAKASTPSERVAVALELAAWRMAAELVEHDRMLANEIGTEVNGA
ncbi:hypothetical protein ACIBHX_01670 [Nonomuraea sp. NPDC050536]|uniref:hypothetical protein n=1 Tax=Nonomuraea sp. NPDC050536 TaxID=3364366 RepID=UPI0037C6B843